MFDMVPHCQFSRCPPLLYGAALSSLAMSTLTISMVSRCPVTRFQSPRLKNKWPTLAKTTRTSVNRTRTVLALRVIRAHSCFC